MGSINQWRDAKDGYTVNNNTLRYNAMQLNVQRRMNRGLQMGLAYTLAKGVGWTGYNPDYLEADPTGELNKLRLWGPTANDRTHNLVINYSYMMPNPTPGVAVLKWILGDWMVSGVTKYLSGSATQPSCTTTNPGIANTNPTLTPGATAACVYTGEPVFEVARDPDLPEEDQLHFNPRAFTMAQPLSATVGNFGNVPLGILRNPGFWNWDLTLPASLSDSGIRAAGTGAAAAAAVQHLQHAAVHDTEHGADVPGRSERSGTRQPAADEHERTAGTRPPTRRASSASRSAWTSKSAPPTRSLSVGAVVAPSCRRPPGIREAAVCKTRREISYPLHSGASKSEVAFMAGASAGCAARTA